MREGLQIFREIAESDESDVENDDEWWCVLRRVMLYDESDDERKRVTSETSSE